MKKYTLVTLCLFLLYLVFPTSDIIRVFADDEGNGSTIAGINVDGLEPNEIENVLNNALTEWLQEEMTVTGGGVELSVDPTKLLFDIPATISEFQTLVKKPWYMFWGSERVVHIPLKVSDNEDIKNEIASVSAWETDETYHQLLSQASFLMDHQVEAKVKNLDIYDSERLALTIRDIPSDAFAPEVLVALLDGKMINPGDVFSFIETVNDGADQVNSQTLNFVSSLLYDVVLQTEFEILERHNGTEIPAFIELGKEATINVNLNEDFKFVNTTDYVGKLKVSMEENSMKVEISSDTKGKEVSVRVEKEVLSPRIIYRYSNDLPVGHEQLLQDGREGYRVIVYRTISGNGLAQEQKVSRDYYPPINEIILKSSKIPPVVEGTNISESTENNDPNLEIDLDGDGLPDIEVPVKTDEEPPVYDKAGSEVTP
ncbi:VanW family protein [Ureibacillus sp. MALMAid1270]|uniref:VanW family protein n=1 Tax=Ureibacillus sp. MALMAid1270 TaxID=3411629 RepID=UPI003BA56156